MSTSDASIIIPIRNTPIGRLQACLDSVAVSRRHCASRVEVILVDDCSREESYVAYKSLLAARYSDVRLTRLHEWRGIGGARNAGAICATSDWLIFVDSDDTVTANCMTEMLRPRSRTTFAYANCIKISGAMVKAYDRLSLFRILNWALQARQYRQLPILFANHIGMPYALHRDVFNTIGGYAENTYSGEHVDLVARAIKSRLLRRYWYVDKILYHYRPMRTGNQFSNIDAHVSGKAAAFLKNSRMFGDNATHYEFAGVANSLPALYLPYADETPIVPDWAITFGAVWGLNREHEAMRCGSSGWGSAYIQLSHAGRVSHHVAQL